MNSQNVTDEPQKFVLELDALGVIGLIISATMTAVDELPQREILALGRTNVLIQRQLVEQGFDVLLDEPGWWEARLDELNALCLVGGADDG